MKTNIIKKAGNAVSKILGRKALVIKKHSPEILVAVGVVGVGVGMVLACKAALKANDILDAHKENVAHINKVKEFSKMEDYDGEEYTDKDYKKDLAVNTLQTTGKILKAYAPAIIVTTLAVGCIIGSHKILKKRNLGLMAAYKALDESFAKYRERVAERLGDDEEKRIRYDVKEETVTTEDGKEKVVETSDPTSYSQYAKFFDESCKEFSKIPDYNYTFLVAQQQAANNKLHAQGHLFLNEVYDMLGIDRTPAGALVGWVDGNGSNYVDFGIYNASNPKARQFVNGQEKVFLLDFNVDGVIYDLI